MTGWADLARTMETAVRTDRSVVSRALIGCLLAACGWATATAGAEEEHDEHGDEEAGFVSLEPHERIEAGVETQRVDWRSLRAMVRLPAEVVVNGYRSARVTPKIPSVVEARHVRLGDVVEAGQPLASLSSIDMADAAGELMLAAYEWRLVRELGPEAVSGRRYAEAETAERQAMAKVIGYGLTEAQARALATSDDLGAFTGRFDLLAPRGGTVFSDDFVLGELVEPGRVLVEVVDESTVWVEARAADLPEVERGDPAVVVADDGRRILGQVDQRHHRLDETTRTQALRIEVDNAGDALHPGQFVEVEIETGIAKPVLAVPRSAIAMLHGRESAFRLEDDEFHPVPIATGRNMGDWVVVQSGLEPGNIVATAGVFHLKSLLLKSSLGSGHAH